MSSGIEIKTKVLKGKYKIKSNIFASCKLNVYEADDSGFRTFITTKDQSDTEVPAGTSIYLDADSINRIKGKRSNAYDNYSVTVKTTEKVKGRALHNCTPLLKETFTDRRKQPRKNTEFLINEAATKTGFIAQNGTVQGLQLLSRSRQAVLKLQLDKQTTFQATYKGKSYQFPARVVYIQYDWKGHNHIIGIQFSELDDEQETILNLLIDPSFEIDISSKQTVDGGEGMIRSDR